MTASSLATESRPTSQQSTRGGRRIDHIVLHHCATTDMDGVLRMMQTGSREVSANYVVKDNRIATVVPEEMRSWSLSSAEWDGRSITFEIANESNGGAWPVSAASHVSVARVVADIGRRYGIPINRDTVLGHREVYTRHGASYATACPGGLDIDRIVALANSGAGSSSEETEMLYRASAASADGLIKSGWLYKQVGAGPVCAVTNLESIALTSSGQFIANYHGNDIRLLGALYGFAEHEQLKPGNTISNGTPLSGPGRLTGRLIFSDNAKPELPKVAGVTSGTIDPAPISAAAKAGAAEAVAGLKVPTEAAIAKAVNDDAAARLKS